MFFSKKRDIKLLEERCGNVVRYAHIFFFILTQYISIKYTFFLYLPNFRAGNY